MISKSTILVALVEEEVVAGTTPGLILKSRYVPYCDYSSMLVLDLCKCVA